MIAVVQRVRNASVAIKDSCKRATGRGLVVLVGVGIDDERKDINYTVQKILGLRIFPDESGKMNLSVRDIKGDLLVISQFTLYGDARKGKRPDFTKAAPALKAKEYYDEFVAKMKQSGLNVQTGEFAAEMLVEINNDGPVTILLESPK